MLSISFSSSLWCLIFPSWFSSWLIIGSPVQLGHAFFMDGETLSAYIGKLCRSAVLNSFQDLFKNWALFYLINPFCSTSSCEVISREFFLASTTAFVAWLGTLSLHLFCFNLNFLSLASLTILFGLQLHALFIDGSASHPSGCLMMAFSPVPSRVIAFCWWQYDSSFIFFSLWVKTVFSFWRDTQVYGYNSPLKSLKELISGS